MDSKTSRLATILTGIFLSVSLSFVLSLVGNLLGTRENGRFSIGGWLILFAASTIVSLALGLIIPISRAAKGASKGMKLKENSIPARLIETLIIDIIYNPVINFLMVFIARQNAIANGAPPQAVNLGMMFLRSFPGAFVTGYIFIFIVMPLFEKLGIRIAEKKAKKEKRS